MSRAAQISFASIPVDGSASSTAHYARRMQRFADLLGKLVDDDPEHEPAAGDEEHDGEHDPT